MAKQKFAAFDIDGTVSRNSIFFAVVEELVKLGHIPAIEGVELAEKFEQYRQRAHKEIFNEYSELSVKILFDHMQELKVSDYRQAVDNVLKRQKAHTYVYTRELIKTLKDKGYYLIAISGSEMYSVQQFCDHYGFDAAVGETYKEEKGRLTGEVESVVRRKDYYLRYIIDKCDLTLEGSIAIGDSKSDALMLELVENPIAFNPENRLYEIAKDRGWKIVLERKNVIYELEPKNGTYILKK